MGILDKVVRLSFLLFFVILLGCAQKDPWELDLSPPKPDINDYAYIPEDGYPEKLHGYYHTLFKSKKNSSDEDLSLVIAMLHIEKDRITKSYMFDRCTADIKILESKKPGEYLVEEVKSDSCPNLWDRERRYTLKVEDINTYLDKAHVIEVRESGERMRWGTRDNTYPELMAEVKRTMETHNINDEGTFGRLVDDPEECHNVGEHIRKNNYREVRGYVVYGKIDVIKCVYRTRTLTYAAQYYGRFKMRDMFLEAGGNPKDVEVAREHRKRDDLAYGTGLVIGGFIAFGLGEKIVESISDFLEEYYSNSNQHVVVVGEANCPYCEAEDLDFNSGPRELIQDKDEDPFGAISRINGSSAGTYHWSLVVEQRVCRGVLNLRESSRAVLLSVTRQCAVTVIQE